MRMTFLPDLPANNVADDARMTSAVRTSSAHAMLSTCHTHSKQFSQKSGTLSFQNGSFESKSRDSSAKNTSALWDFYCSHGLKKQCCFFIDCGCRIHTLHKVQQVHLPIFTQFKKCTFGHG